jgi:hypothetical protein
MADPLSTSINPVNDIQARQFISIFADATTAPVLTTPDLDTCLTYSRRQDANVNPPDPYTTWQAATAYAVGAAVVADPRNGSYFTATVAGTTGTTQPTWPTVTDGTVVDGGVTWKNAGAAAWSWSWALAGGSPNGLGDQARPTGDRLRFQVRRPNALPQSDVPQRSGTNRLLGQAGSVSDQASGLPAGPQLRAVPIESLGRLPA